MRETGAKVEKRPLLHPAIAPKYAGSSLQKVVYVGTNTSFMSAFKRVKNLLSQVDQRRMQSEYALAKKQAANQSRGRGARHTTEDTSVTVSTPEEIVIKGTGKAIEKTLRLGLYLQSQDDVNVQVRTGTVSAIDDINTDDISNGDDPGDIPEARIRHTSMVEIGVSLKA